MTHRLDPLLRPRAVAVVGASATPHSMGAWTLENLRRGGYPGPVYPVNPGRGDIGGQRCYKRIAELPEVPDLAIFAVGDHRVEQALDEAIDFGIPAAVIMSTLVVDDDEPPGLRERVRRKVAEAGMLVCGANGMGFYNVRDRMWACGFDSRLHEPPGNAALISHSGSGMCSIIDCEARLRVNFAVSTGNELSVTMDQYLDFVLELPETRVVGLFVETARNPAGFRAALAKAVDRRIPVVALKVGRTKKAAELTVSHSGAMAGDDATYDALFDAYGVHRVADMDEMATAMILFAELGIIGDGGLVTLHDSGGERQLMVDLADAAGVPMTNLSPSTEARLRAVLAPELPPVNPLDGWSRGGSTAEDEMAEMLSIMMQDDGAALGAIVLARAPNGGIYRTYEGYLKRAAAASGKPSLLVAARQGTGSDELVVELTHQGYPVLDGVVTFLQGVRGLMAYRDFLARPAADPPAAPGRPAVQRWRERLRTHAMLGEAEALDLLADFGIPSCLRAVAGSEPALRSAAAELRYPLVLKTAMPGIAHKSDVGGVVLGIRDEAHLVRAYAAMAESLGPRVLVAEMAAAGVEMILGMRRDPQFGPIVMVGFGGVLTEVVRDVGFLLPPVDAREVRRRLDRLRLRKLLDGVRGRPPAAIDAFCELAARFSVLAAALGDALEEIDVNPVIVGAEHCSAVDALIIGSRAG